MVIVLTAFIVMCSGIGAAFFVSLRLQQPVENNVPLTESHLSDPGGIIPAGVTCLLISGAAALVAAHHLKKPFEAIETLKESAEAALIAQSGFLANMSHEMRMSLNAVIGLSELTLNGDVSGDARENIEKVYSSGMTLLGIVNDILDLSKIESGQFELVPVEYELPSLINDTITLNTMRIGSKPVKFHLRINENLPVRLHGDDLRIKQIFNNLLSTAFKYTREGSIEWSLSAERDGDYVRLAGTVRVSGTGIRADDMAALFDGYKQADMKRRRVIKETGLGLALTRRMAEMMNGSITVESEHGTGCVFTVCLRQRYVSDAVIGKDTAANLMNFHHDGGGSVRTEGLTRVQMPYARVLVVDDVTTNLSVARGLLKPYGMRVDCVTSGRKAVDLIQNGEVKYSAIFMDHMMPEMDGMEAVRIIRQETGTEYAKNIPIIALTANTIAGNEELFLKSGFQAFLSKPIDIMALDAAVLRWIRDPSKEGAAPAGELPPQPETAPAPSVFAGQEIPGIDIAGGLKHFGGSEETYLDVLRTYAQSTPALLEKIRSPAAASLANYAIDVHGIKGGSRNIGAVRLGDHAEELEHRAKAGDFDSVNAHTAAFVAEAESLLAALSGFLSGLDRNKPRLPAPGAENLAALLAACKAFDIDEVDKAMENLTSYEYDQDGGLVEWLREQVSLAGFKQIAGKLEALGNSGSQTASAEK
jgi:signal transduction histidine kinase/CheY-like chemotaxis protein/HPt (histidine-containing phosphotransfer) domain-containing protein